MRQKLLIIILTVGTLNVFAQNGTSKDKKRLDFAKTYFEVGGMFLPSFTGKRLLDNWINTFENSPAVIQYLNWGGFHFWGHGEFYVTIPLGYNPFEENEETSSELFHSVATGFRLLPWVYQEKKFRPYVGISWSALDFKQIVKDEQQPVLSKDFMLVYDAGLLYGYRDFSLRIGVNYYRDNKWSYPISKLVKDEIKTPNFSLQLGLMYAFEGSKNKDEQINERWNNYPTLSKQSLGATKFGDFYIGVGPSLSYSLKKSDYNLETFPYLKEKLTSTNYFDFTVGYHFQKLGLFTNLSFRNPKFETEGYGTKQTIRKTSLAIEVNKFLLDYSGFTPYLGVNVAFDKIKYTENIDDINKELSFGPKLEPGITFGWDIQPGKNQEALILRTNLRWYPFAAFEVDGKSFDFDQLEYNLIQVVFYPGRLEKRKR